MLIPPKRLVFTGGGLRTLCHFGVLDVLQQRGLLSQLKEVIGVSAGALVGFTYMLGYTIDEMKKAVVEFDFSVLQNAHPELVLDFFSKYGIDSGEYIEKFLVSLLRIKGYPIDMTFGEWYQRNPNAVELRCYAADLNAGTMKEFSRKTTPDIPFVFALRASMSLPLYFTPVQDPQTGHYLVDGGLIHNFPFQYLTEEEKETALGISFLYSQDAVESISDFLGFLKQIYNTGFNPRTYQVQKENKLHCLIIPTEELSAYNFDLTKEYRQNLIERGQKAANDFCDGYLQHLFKHKRPIRRYSVH